jgi:NSS family neurotransmitter:Na+ symporter
MANRGSWGSNAGFILAAVGGAVGLGNLWGFAYSASQGGGAAFLLLYLLFVVGLGIPVLTAELVIGRATGQSPIRALAATGGPAWRPLGILFVIAAFGILSFYSVIMGWTGRMLLDFLRGAVPQDTAAYFGAVSEGADAVAFHLAGMLLTILVIVGGVQRGIERVSVVLMPVLFALVAGLAVWASTLSGAGPGYDFYLQPDLSKVFHVSTITGAAGQAFFSLSLGMGAMITYASYLEGRSNLAGQAATIAFSDTLVAFVGGLVTFPIIWHFGLQAEIGASTIGALFIAVPHGFLSMGAAGQIVGVAFFLTLYIAAITSAISLLEVATAAAIDSLGWSRTRSAWIAGIAIAVLGIPSALNSDLIGFLFSLFGEVFLLFGGLMLSILCGWVWTRRAREEIEKGVSGAAFVTLWIWLLRTVVPLVLVVVLWFSAKGVIASARALVASG